MRYYEDGSLFKYLTEKKVIECSYFPESLHLRDVLPDHGV